MHYKSIFNAAVAVAAAGAAVFFIGCSEKPDDEGGNSGGGGGGKGNDISNYRTVTIGSQTWMAENLDNAVSGSVCYGEDGKVIIGWDEEKKDDITKTLSSAEVQANCAKYGRLYT